jgi:hypothetical protein
MKIVITEEQFDSLKKEQLKSFLFKYWDSLKKKGKKLELDEIVYDIVGVKKHSSEDHKIVRPIWYEYNGGYEGLLTKLKEETKDKPFKIKGDNNLNIVVYVDYVIDYGEMGGYVDVICSIYGGTIDYEFYVDNSNQVQLSKNTDIFDVYSDLEYDRSDLTQFVKDTVEDYFDNEFEYLGIPLYVEITW